MNSIREQLRSVRGIIVIKSSLPVGLSVGATLMVGALDVVGLSVAKRFSNKENKDIRDSRILRKNLRQMVSSTKATYVGEILSASVRS